MATIAIFDSGIGGITFLALARQCMPNENFIYFADTDHVPYGTKTTDEVRCLVSNAVDFLCSRNIDILVLACNTATSAACNALRSSHVFPIVGMEPALKPALAAAWPKKVLLFSTSLTMREDKLRRLISNLDATPRVDALPLDELVRTAERFEFDTPHVRRIIADALSAYPLEKYGAVVLGCTHFIYYRDIIRRALPGQVPILDGNQGTLNNLQRILDANQLQARRPGGAVTFFSSGRPDARERVDRLLTLMQHLQSQNRFPDPRPTQPQRPGAGHR